MQKQNCKKEDLRFGPVNFSGGYAGIFIEQSRRSTNKKGNPRNGHRAVYCRQHCVCSFLSYSVSREIKFGFTEETSYIESIERITNIQKTKTSRVTKLNTLKTTDVSSGKAQTSICISCLLFLGVIS